MMPGHSRRRRAELLSSLRRMSEIRKEIEEKENEINEISANLAAVRALWQRLDSAEIRMSKEIERMQLSVMAMRSELVSKPLLYVTNRSELTAVSVLKNFYGFNGRVELVAEKREDQENLESKAMELGLKSQALG